MHNDLLDPTKNIKFSSRFWFDPATSAPDSSISPRNLYELFVLDVAMLVEVASQAHQAARSLYRSLPSDQAYLREFVFGLGYPVCSCLPDLPAALIDEGIVLPLKRESTVKVLLSTIQPETWATHEESWNLVAVRICGVYHKIALHLEAQIIDAAENAYILGSASLNEAFNQWSAVWREYVVDLCERKPVFLSRAYASGPRMPIPLWQVA